MVYYLCTVNNIYSYIFVIKRIWLYCTNVDYHGKSIFIWVYGYYKNSFENIESVIIKQKQNSLIYDERINFNNITVYGRI